MDSKHLQSSNSHGQACCRSVRMCDRARQGYELGHLQHFKLLACKLLPASTTCRQVSCNDTIHTYLRVLTFSVVCTRVITAHRRVSADLDIALAALDTDEESSILVSSR